MSKNYNLLRGKLFLQLLQSTGKKPIWFLGLMLLTSIISNAQVATNSGSGLSGTYPDLASAITALNSATITSPIVITLTGDETAPVGGYVISAEGTSTNTITIQGSSSTITAALQTAGSLNDAIFKFVGADWVTLQGFTMTENAANTVSTIATNDMTEWGVALLYTTTTNGAQNNTIQNNTIDLTRTYANTFGIYSNSTHADATPATAATATSVTGGNHNLKIYGNTITDVNLGIVVVGPTAAADHNDGLDIGGVAAATGNTITDFGLTGTFTSPYQNVASNPVGIVVRNTKNFNVSYNTITSSNGGATTGSLRGILINAFNNAPTGIITNSINNNVISLMSGNVNGITALENSATTTNATTTLNINNNDFNNIDHILAASSAVTFINSLGVALNTNINGNTFSNLSLSTTGNVTFISNSLTRPANAICNVNNNAIVGSFSKTGAGGTITFYNSNGVTPTSGTENNLNNNFSNVTVTGATTINAWISTDGAASSPFGPGKNISNNTFNNITGGTSPITVLSVAKSNNASTTNNVSNNTISNITNGAAITGITSANGIQNFFGNTVNSLTTTGASTVSALVVVNGGTAQNIYKNKIYNIESNNAAGIVNGILVSGGTAVSIYNNIIGDLRTPATNAANPLIGINITGGTTVNVYYNTVNLNGSSSAALFGSSAISVATGPTVTLRNNIFANNSTISGAELAVAYRRSSSTLTSYAAASNNNLFYGSTIYTDGTNTDTTLGAFKTRMATRDMASVSENPNFVSTVGSNVNFLHINPAIATQIESGAATIATFTDDFDGDIRNVSSPDIGADEFAGVSASVVINNVAINPVGNQCTAISRTVTANITAGSSNITSVTLNYSFDGVAQSPISMTGGTLTASTTSTFTGTIPVAVPVNANVAWSVTTIDPLASKVSSGTAYQDEPLFGSIAAANASVVSLCNGGSTILSASLTKNGTKNVGSGSSTTTLSGTSSTNYVSPFTHWLGGYKAQYIIRASELTALGFGAGNNLTSLAFDVTTASTVNYTGFTLRMGTTPATVLTATFDASSLTQVYTGDLAVSATGLLTLPFGTGAGSATSFTWDGTSNVLINLCWSNNNTGGATPGSAEVKYDTTSFVAMAYYKVDSTSPATVCGTSAASATLSNRPKMVFGGNFVPAITSISWSDGSTVVGTGNNLSVSPTVNTSYTATLTSSGCTINTNSVAVTVNTTAAPTGTSPQTFANGQTLADVAVTGSSVIWYASASDAASAINPLPNTTLLVDTVTYYATQTISGCASTASLAVTADVPLSVNSFDSTAFKSYPNPVNNVLNLSYAKEMTSLEIFNLIGQRMSVKKINTKSIQVDMSSFAQGAYFIKVTSGEESKTIKIIKN